MERKKFNRIIRSERLTPEQVARDSQLRRKLVEEFPPAHPSSREGGELSDALRKAIQSSAKSVYQICKEAGISQIVVSRFLAGERDIRLATADRLARALGLTVESHG